MGRDTFRISRRHRMLTVAGVLGEAGELEVRERDRLARILWEGWREVMRTRLAAVLRSECEGRKRRR